MAVPKNSSKVSTVAYVLLASALLAWLAATSQSTSKRRRFESYAARLAPGNVTAAKETTTSETVATSKNKTTSSAVAVAETANPTAFRKVFYVKTHKTGSSTLQNILFRYGHQNNLTFALPDRKNLNRFGYPRSIRPNDVENFHGKLDLKSADVVLNHMAFNKNILKIFSPKMLKITIVRDPAKMFESSYSYFNHACVAFKRSGTLKRFLEDPDFWHDRFGSYMSRNYQMFDLGYRKFNHHWPSENLEVDPEVGDAIAELDQVFDLILVTDYFDESILLLKKYLSTSSHQITYEDLAYMKKQERPEKFKSLETLTEAEVAKIYEWNRADTKLFEHFKSKLLKTLDIEFPDKSVLAAELESLRAARAKVTDKCVASRSAKPKLSAQKNKFLYQPKGVLILQETLNQNLSRSDSDLCHQYSMLPMEFTGLMFEKMKQRFEPWS